VNIPVGLVAVVVVIVIAELGRALLGKLFGYQAERHVIPIMKLPGDRGTTGFRLALILAGPVTGYLAVAVVAFGFFRSHGSISADGATEVVRLVDGFDAASKLQIGDTITEVDGIRFDGGAEALRQRVHDKHGAPLTLQITRGGEHQTVTVAPTEKSGTWLLGISLGATREYSTLASIKEAIAYPVRQSASTFEAVIEIFKGKPEIDAGGPVRIVQEFTSASDGLSASELLLMACMVFGTYALIALALFDLVRALFLILFRS
jgi:membrane-associated protease RseP (regulator of RpoE activity)